MFKEYILGFDVPVENSVIVQFVQPSQYLLGYNRHFGLCEFRILIHSLVEGSRRAVLQEDVDIFDVEEEPVHLDYIGVVEEHLDLDLSE